MSNQFDKDKYKKIDEQTDGFLEQVKESKWTPVLVLVFIIAVLLLGYALG